MAIKKTGKDMNRDDWEVLQMILEENAPLRQRVLHKIREIRGTLHAKAKVYTSEELKEIRLKEQKEKQEHKEKS